MLIDRLTNLVKKTASLDRALRYNPRHYAPLRRQLRELNGMDRDERRAASEALLHRTLLWAARLPDGLGADVPLDWRPIIEREQLRDDPRRYTVAGLVRVPASTGGTSGVPVRVERSLRCVAAEQAFIDDLAQRAGIDLQGARIARLRADNVKPVADTTAPFGIYRDGGRCLVLSSNHLNASSVAWYRDELLRFRPQVLFAHPSAVEALAGLLLQCGDTVHVPLVMTSSEVVHPVGRRLIQQAFGATVVDHYGMAERVAFAAAAGGSGYRFNPLYGHVELRPIDRAEAPAGHRALEIVATGFWNEVMPLVRYRPGDRVIVPQSYGDSEIEDVTLGLAPVVAIQGRGKEHVLSPDGVVVVGVSNAVEGVRGLVRMQVVQDALDAVTIHVIADPKIGSIDEAHLMRNLRLRLSPAIAIEIRQVRRLERLPSGKTPFIIQRALPLAKAA
jgi:phenylacetate-CoA ligase